LTNNFELLVTSQDIRSSVEKRVGSLAAKVVEVIEINGPNGRTGVPVVHDEAGLLPDGVDVIEADPLTVSESVWAAGIRGCRFGQLVRRN